MTSSVSDESVFTFDEAVLAVRGGKLTETEALDRLLAQLTERELLWLLDGDTPAWQMIRLPKIIRSAPVVSGAIPRIGYPGIRFTDGPRGVTVGQATAFPVSMARAATWDPDLEERVGTAMGLESRAKGGNYSGAVCINLVRHPAWGRAQESYGEDPVLVGRMGAALTRGLRRNVMACVKHYALNSLENMRFVVDVTVDEHALHEVYLPHFRTVIDAGADSVMSSYNSVNGAFMGENMPLLSDVLRDEWDFAGAVTSDWVQGVRDGVVSLEAGLDVEMPLRRLRARALPKALATGRIPRALVVRSARRVLGMTLRHAAQRSEAEPGPEIVASSDHVALAREVATAAMVLLKNDEVDGERLLPLGMPPRICVIGALGVEPNLGDHGSSRVLAPSTSSPLEGVRKIFVDSEIDFDDGADVKVAAGAASSASVAVVVVGLGPDDEGERIWSEPDPEDVKFPMTLAPVRAAMTKVADVLSGQFGRGGDRDSLTLSEHDERLIEAVARANPHTVVVLIGGSSILVETWHDQVPAILMAWYPGMEGGAALAAVLRGLEEPGGRLPAVIPKSSQHLPDFDPRAKQVVYDEWWGQRKLDRDGNSAAYPFGFGLGYSTFEMKLVDEVPLLNGQAVRVLLTNTGKRRGSAVPQLYAVNADDVRRVPQLVGFRKVALDAGEQTTVDIAVDLTPTRVRDPKTREWSTRPGRWQIVVASHSPEPLGP